MTDTDERMIREIARLCSLPESRVERTVTLLQGGATIPFITRYRKEATGGLDEVQVGAVRDQLERLNALEARKRTVRSAIEAAGKMTGALSARRSLRYRGRVGRGKRPGPGSGPRGVCPRGGPLVAGCRRQGGRGR